MSLIAQKGGIFFFCFFFFFAFLCLPCVLAHFLPLSRLYKPTAHCMRLSIFQHIKQIAYVSIVGMHMQALAGGCDVVCFHRREGVMGTMQD